MGYRWVRLARPFQSRDADGQSFPIARSQVLDIRWTGRSEILRFQSLLAVKISTLPSRVFKTGTVDVGFDDAGFSLVGEWIETSFDGVLRNAG